MIIELNSKGNDQYVNWDLDTDTFLNPGGNIPKTGNTEKKKTREHSRSRTVTFRLLDHHVSPEQGKYALGRTSGPEDNARHAVPKERRDPLFKRSHRPADES